MQAGIQQSTGAKRAANAPRSPHDQVLLSRFKELTETILPARARTDRWPIRYDHCFKRICLDHAFGDVWYNHLPRSAERHLQGQPLERAAQCAEDLHRVGLPLLRLRNAASLGFRGKASPR